MSRLASITLELGLNALLLFLLTLAVCVLIALNYEDITRAPFWLVWAGTTLLLGHVVTGLITCALALFMALRWLAAQLRARLARAAS